MNWYKISKSIQYPLIKDFHGYRLTNIGSSYNSISSTFSNYEILKGIREVPFSSFSNPKNIFYASNDIKSSKELAYSIKYTKSIEPLIIVFDNEEGPYILEGAHRFYALSELGFSTFPALIVIDKDDEIENNFVNDTNKYNT